MADEYSSTTAAEEQVAVIISDSEGEDNDDGIVENFDGSPHITLPPEVWAMVINYLPYDSLISCASTSRTMLNDALPLVTTLHIEKASHLNIGLVSKNLRDVRSISIYNLFVKDRSGTVILDEDIATQSVPFLSNAFPQLESVAFWGKCGDNLLSLNTVLIDANQRFYVYTLLESLSGAFGCRAIRNSLQIIGLSCPNTRVDVDGSCKACKRVCNTFPLEITGDVDLCLRFATSNELIMSRKGGKDYLQSEIRFMQLLSKSHVSSSQNGFCIIGQDYEVRSELTRMVESSKLDVSKLNLNDVVKAIKKRHPNNISVYYLSGDSFDLLKSIGLPISNDLLDPDDPRVENLDRIARSVMEVKDSFFSPVIGLKKIDDLLANNDTKTEQMVQLVVETGLLPKLVELLSRDNDNELQSAAVEVLINIASGERKHVEEVVKLGAIPPLVRLLGSSHSEIPSSAAWVLGNIAVDDHIYRDLVLQAGMMRPLLKLLEDHQTSDVESVRTYMWILAGLCRDAPKHLVRPSLPTLNELIYHSDEEVVTNSYVALSCLSQGPNKQIQAVIDELNDTGVRQLVELLNHPSISVQSPALTTVGNIASGNESQTQIIIDNGALPSLLTLLSSTNDGVRKDTCWAISNITAGTVEQIQAVIDCDFIPKVISLLKDDSSGVCKETAWLVANCTSNGSSKQLDYLVNQGCILPLFDLLTAMNDVDTKIVTIILEALVNVSQVSTEDKSHIKSILDANDNRSTIEELQHHDDDAVRQLSTRIVEMHFPSV